MANRQRALQRAQLLADEGCVFAPGALAEELTVLQGDGAQQS